ncbi:MAG: DinB family protein [Candidatus Acidiferrales bacterium]
MKKLFLAVSALILVTSFGARQTFAQAAPTAQPEDKTAPSYDMKAQALLDLDTVNKKVISLAEVIPQDKYNWRPSPDSRSFAEVFLHVSGERYQILALGGVKPPADFNGKTYEISTTDKAQIVEQLKKTGEFMLATINAMTNADFAKLLPKLGPQANAGDPIYILVADAHEHLGQLVAYARENDIVPPWTVAAKKAAAEKAAKQKPEGEKKP